MILGKKKLVSDICSEFTQKLEEVEMQQHSEALKLSEEIAAKQVKLDHATKEHTRASSAIVNIKKMFGIEEDGV